MAQYRSRWTGEVIDDAVDKVRKIAYINLNGNPQEAYEAAETAYSAGFDIIARYDRNMGSGTLIQSFELVCVLRQQTKNSSQQTSTYYWFRSFVTHTSLKLAFKLGCDYGSTTATIEDITATYQWEATQETLGIQEQSNYDIAEHDIPEGSYVYFKAGIAKAITNIAVGDTLRAVSPNRNLAWISNGGLNDLKSAIDRFPHLNGKKIYIYGDSLSDETSQATAGLQPNWVTVARGLLPDSTITNRALAGARISGSAPSIRSIVDAETEIDADIIILFGGTNDYRHSAELGYFEQETPATGTFCGSLEIIRNKFISLAPSAKVFVITPPKLINTNMPSDYNSACPPLFYRNALATFASMNGYSLIDGHSFPLLNPYNSTMKTMYQSDGVHQLPAYAPILANYILEKINSYGDNALSREITRANISAYASSGVTVSYAYADCDTDGGVTLAISGTYTATAGSNFVMMTLPYFLRPNASGAFAMHVQSGTTFEAWYCDIGAATGNITIQRAPSGGTTVFSLSYYYKTRFGGYSGNPS